MAEVTRRRRGELMRGVCRILLDEADGLPRESVLERLAREVPPTPFEGSDYPNRPGVRRYEKVVQFSAIGPTKAGWLTRKRGWWSLTDEGRSAYEAILDPEEFMAESGRLYRKWRDDRPRKERKRKADQVSPAAATSLEQAKAAAWGEIRDYLERISQYKLQELMAGLLQAMGYHIAWTAPPGLNRGTDIIAHADPLGASGRAIRVQVGRRPEPIEEDELKSFLAQLGDQDLGVVVATGGFTPEAELEAGSRQRTQITLLDLEQLFELWVANYGRLTEEKKELLRLQPVHFLAPQP